MHYIQAICHCQAAMCNDLADIGSYMALRGIYSTGLDKDNKVVYHNYINYITLGGEQ